MNASLLLTDFQKDQLLANCNEALAALAGISQFYPSIADSCRILIGTVKSDLIPKAEQSELIDAARYRWLRDQHWSESPLTVVNDPKISIKLGSRCPSGKLLDYAIDSAMMNNEASEHHGCKPDEQ